MIELPELVVDALTAFRETSGSAQAVAQLQRELAAVGWRLVPETVIPRASVLTSAAGQMLSAASVGTPGGGMGSPLTDTAEFLEQARDFAAAVLGVDLSDLAEHVEGGEP